MKSLFAKHIEDKLEDTITDISPVSGGDISKAFKIQTDSGAYFLKTNTGKKAFHMFQAETSGLQILKKTNTIAIPEVKGCDEFENTAFLLMDFVESKSASAEDFEKLGQHLAELHNTTNDSFGLDSDNYIGSLAQSNSTHKDWSTFYTEERLWPQLQLGIQNKLLSNSEVPTKNRLQQTLSTLFQDIKPSLLHGDLWRGNYLISKEGIPYLIDPAIYFGHHEVDIAMSQLFGGFGPSFYEAYAEHFPFDSHANSRIEIYQLYYLLVHLNLFGSSYYGSVRSILSKYF